MNLMLKKPRKLVRFSLILIDAAFLNFVITDMKRYFEETLQRSLQAVSYTHIISGID